MLRNRLLVISVFLCGAVVMIFELAGSRIMAPYFGGSIYVWTGLIGVIMGSLALGYYVGGKLADKQANVETYSQIILLSGVAIFWTLVLKDVASGMVQHVGWPIEFKSLLVALVLFTPASVFLGLVSPYAVRLKIVSINESASTVGNLYAASTVGSIVGTFLAGYFLIPFLGTDNILFSLVVILVVLSLLLSKKMLLIKIIFFVVLIGCWALIALTNAKNNRIAGIINIETEYNSLKIFPSTQEETGKPLLNLSFDPFSRQSAMFVNDNDLVWDYTKYYRLAKHFVPNLRHSLMIGGGAYSYPKDFLAKFPSASMDVVEIDPGITAAAKKYFRVPSDSRLVTYNEDARAFLNETKNKYDVIFDDAFTSAVSVPFQLTTKEAVKRQHDALNDNGVIIANVGASIDGANGRFLRAEYATFKSVFPQVYIFPVTDKNDANKIQNIMIVALKLSEPAIMSDVDPEINGYLNHLWTHPITNMPVLTDDHAPVEYYMKTII